MSKLTEMGADIGKLCQEKNDAYGDSFAQAHKIIETLYPDGIRPDQYKDALGIIRVIDKLFRIATKKDAFGESPWRDIAGYGILGAVSDDDLGADQFEQDCNDAERFNKEVENLNPVLVEYDPEVDKVTTNDNATCTDCEHCFLSGSEYPCKKCWPLRFTLGLPHYKKGSGIRNV